MDEWERLVLALLWVLIGAMLVIVLTGAAALVILFISLVTEGIHA